jgi:hypothetical protein
MHLLRYLFILLPCCFFTLPALAQTGNDSGRSARDTLRAAPARTRPVPVSPLRQDTQVVRPVQPRRPDSGTLRRADPGTTRTTLPQPGGNQTQDTANLSAADSIAPAPVLTAAQRDSIVSARRSDSIRTRQMILQRIAGFQETLRSVQQWPFFKAPEYRSVENRKGEDKDALFYFLCGLVLYFAILKLAFGKYLDNLFTLFFRVTMRQQQIREQLLQTPLPSLLLNILFAISAGMYLNLVLFYYRLNPTQGFWLSFSYCVGLICLLYLGKLLILKTMGWIFNVSNATNTYLFIVFLVNKMIGMFLLPFLFLLAFPYPALISGMVTLSFILLIALLMYRFIISYRPVRSEINVGRLHFIIYLCAFEIAPLLLIYKVLLNIVESNH